MKQMFEKIFEVWVWCGVVVTMFICTCLLFYVVYELLNKL
jgi:hypothetical protein